MYGDIVAGDNEGGLIGKLNKNTFTEYLQTVPRSFSTSYLTNQGVPILVSSVELNTQAGVGRFKEDNSGNNVSGDIYISSLKNNDYIMTKSMLLLK